MTRSFSAALGVLMLTGAMGTSAEAQSKPAPQSELASVPSTSAYESLSPGNKRIATALFEAQSTPAGSAASMTLEQIAQERRSGRKWGDVFQDMKSQGLIEAETLGQVLGRYDRARHSRS
ncbi:MAG TPA: hypothetical protein VIF11_04265 [Methylomirabilota bacterium]|jgi:hypothetical protein